MKCAWNESKRRKVAEDHHVDFDKVKDVFNDPFAVEYIDEEHSTPDEIRLPIIGITGAYGLTYLVYTRLMMNFISSPQGVPKIGW